MMKNKRGFSIAEVVVTLAIISIISVVASSTILIAHKKSAEFDIRCGVIIIAENTLECFKSADDEDEFVSLLDINGDFDVLTGTTNIQRTTATDTITYTFTYCGINCSLTVTYPDTDGLLDTYVFTSQKEDAEEGVYVYTLNYSKVAK